MPALFDRQLGDERVERVRHHADDQVGPADGRGQGLAPGDVDVLRPAARMPGDELFGPAELHVGDDDGEIFEPEEVFDERPGHEAGAEDEHFFHGLLLRRNSGQSRNLPR